MERRSFDLRKGQIFDLKKDEGLTNIKVRLGWKAGADLDACAFLLGEEGEIINNADFVYYKSANREKPFSKEEFKNKKIGVPLHAQCLPMVQFLAH